MWRDRGILPVRVWKIVAGKVQPVAPDSWLDRAAARQSAVAAGNAPNNKEAFTLCSYPENHSPQQKRRVNENCGDKPVRGEPSHVARTRLPV
jgi:hypothetical protein